MGVLTRHEDALEGAFWRLGHDLADVYRDRVTLRQLWVRVRALPAGSPLHESLAEEQQRADEAQQSADLDDALTRYRRPR